ncbi:MAG: MFS transporter [Eubacteriales bacterium]
MLLTNPSAGVIIAIHGIWGITSLMTFWPANVKALRLCGNDAEQGKVFGFFEGGRGVTNAAVYAVAAALFAAFFTAQSQMSGIREIIMLYSGIPIAMGIANIFLLRGIDESSSTSTNSGIDLKLVGKVLKDPKVWLMSLIILCAYTVNMGNYYIGSYTTAAFSMTALGAAVISSSSQYIRPFAAGGAGIIADKINASKVMMLGLLLSAIGLGIIYIAPEGGNVTIVLVGTVIVFISMFMTQSMHFAMMGEHEFTPEATGTIIGIACTIGYLPEFFLAPMVGRILDTYQNSPEGYRMVFMILIGFVVVGMFLTALWMKDTKVRRAEILAEKKAMVKA